MTIVSGKSAVQQNTCNVGAKVDLEHTFLSDFFETQQFSSQVFSDLSSVASSLNYVELEVENSPKLYKAMIDSGTIIAVANSSLIPEECREYVGKTRLQGAFGECVDAELVTLRVRLKTDTLDFTPMVEVMSISIVFALTDALASKNSDMLLPMHAVVELRNYQEVHVVFSKQTESFSKHEPSHDVLDDDVTVVSDDDLDQHQGSCVDNADDLRIKITNQSNLKQLTREQIDDPSLKSFWDTAKKHKGHMCIKNGLLYHKDSVGGMPVEQLAVPSGRHEKLIRLAHQTLTGSHMRAQKTRKRLCLHFFFPGMRKKMFTVLSHCRECQLKASQKVSDNVPITLIVRPTLPFMVAHANLISPLDPPSSQGHTYALCVVGACTRWLSVYLLKATNSKTICDCFIDLFQHTGIYETIVMDNGPNLCSKLMTEFMTRLGATPRFIIPYHCQANGLVERFNQSFKSMLHFAMREHARAWHKAVPFLVWCMRVWIVFTRYPKPILSQFAMPNQGFGSN